MWQMCEMPGKQEWINEDSTLKELVSKMVN